MRKFFNVLFVCSFFIYLFIIFLVVNSNYMQGANGNLSIYEYFRDKSNFIPCKRFYDYYNGQISFKQILIQIGSIFGLCFPLGIYVPYFIENMNKVSWLVVFSFVILCVGYTYLVVTKKSAFDIELVLFGVLGSLAGLGIGKLSVVKDVLFVKNDRKKRYSQYKISIEDWNWY